MSHFHSHSEPEHRHHHNHDHSHGHAQPHTAGAAAHADHADGDEQSRVNEAHQRDLERQQREKFETMTEEEKNMQLEAEHFQDIINAYNYYGSHMFQRFMRKEADFDSLSHEHRALLPGFKQKMVDVRTAIMKNQFFIRNVTENTQIFLHGDARNIVCRFQPKIPTEHNMEKVRSTLRQCVRDWSDYGSAEWYQCYGPILNELKNLYPNPEGRTDIKVLNPGCGMGRLTWEIAHLGFESQGNEFSYFMLLASNTLLNRSSKEQHAIYPFVHETCNMLKLEDQFREIVIPNVDPCSLPKTSKFSMAAGDFVEVYGESEHFRGYWDCVSACFFLDTAHNILEYLKVISKILKPGGYLITLGPLLYHYADIENELSLEITYEELRPSFEYYGLKIIKEEFDVPSSYAQNPNSLLQMHYKCIFSVLQRVADCPADRAEIERKEQTVGGIDGGSDSNINNGDMEIHVAMDDRDGEGDKSNAQMEDINVVVNDHDG